MRILYHLIQKNFSTHWLGFPDWNRAIAAAGIAVFSMFLCIPAFAADVYYSNSIWLPLEKTQKLPDEGYALKIFREADQNGYIEGYFDGELVYWKEEELQDELLVIREEQKLFNQSITQEYFQGNLMREIIDTPEGRKEIEYTYTDEDEIDSITVWQDGELSQEQFIFRYRDGALRTVYRYRNDELLQFFTLRQQGYTIGTDQEMMRESWEENILRREVYHKNELVYEYLEQRDTDEFVVTERDKQAGKATTKSYKGELLQSEIRESRGRKERITYAYDESALLVQKTTEITIGERTTLRDIEYIYTDDGLLKESRLKVNGKLQEVTRFDQEGEIVEKSIYRDGRKIVTHTYD